jgi:superkiller protein 3
VNLGLLLFDRGELAAATEQFQKALEINPTYALAYNNLGLVRMAAGRYAESVELYRKAIALDPIFLEPHANLGCALGQLGQSGEAVTELRRYLHRHPDSAKVQGWLAWTLGTARDDKIRNGREALELARKAAAADNADPSILDALAAAEAETGQYAVAVVSATAARDLALKFGQRDLAAAIERRIALYRQDKPYRQ